ISNATIIPQPFDVPADFDIDAVLAGAWGIWFGDANDEVVLRFDAAVADRVREQNVNPEAVLTDVEGGVEMRVRVASEIEMRPWVLGWGAAVEVIAPPSLRDHVASQARAVAALYGKQAPISA